LGVKIAKISQKLGKKSHFTSLTIVDSFPFKIKLQPFGQLSVGLVKLEEVFKKASDERF